jgi:hypothetical protein
MSQCSSVVCQQRPRELCCPCVWGTQPLSPCVCVCGPVLFWCARAACPSAPLLCVTGCRSVALVCLGCMSQWWLHAPVLVWCVWLRVPVCGCMPQCHSVLCGCMSQWWLHATVLVWCVWLRVPVLLWCVWAACPSVTLYCVAACPSVALVCALLGLKTLGLVSVRSGCVCSGDCVKLCAASKVVVLCWCALSLTPAA